jgi:hypothetical protein
MEEVPISSTYMVECKRKHRFSLETCWDNLRLNLSEGRLPACPLANGPPEQERCSYVLTLLEIEQV